MNPEIDKEVAYTTRLILRALQGENLTTLLRTFRRGVRSTWTEDRIQAVEQKASQCVRMYGQWAETARKLADEMLIPVFGHLAANTFVGEVRRFLSNLESTGANLRMGATFAHQLGRITAPQEDDAHFLAEDVIDFSERVEKILDKWDRLDPPERLAQKKLDAALAWIQQNIILLKRAGSQTSYGMKHDLERDIGLYLTNGEFKYAMRRAGHKPLNPRERNWVYRAKVRPRAKSQAA